MVEALVWLGTITFAASGALVAVARRFDIVGTVALAAVTAVGGGSIRDIVSGDTPLPIFADEGLLWAVAATGIVVFAFHSWVPEGRLLYALDTLGLAVFAVLGAERGLAVGFGFWGTVFAGTISGVGGGVLRDLLAGRVPGILYRSGDFYAFAALVGAAVVFALESTNASGSLVAGAVATVVVRVGSRLANLHLPVAREPT